MKTLGRTGRNWLLTFHVFLVSVWIGAALSSNLMLRFNTQMQSDEALLTLHVLVKKLDLLIIPSGVGVLLTSLLISTLTGWGFFKFRWHTVTWVLYFVLLASGIAVLGPLTDSLLAIARSEGIAALGNPVYTRDSTLLFIFGTIQVLGLWFLIWLVEFKPWGRTPDRQEGPES